MTTQCQELFKDSDWNTSCAMWSLTGKPNKNVNFVTGVNGSGKSSILQGLVLGLLADSKHTKRYHKLQDFIQKGYKRATVQVEWQSISVSMIISNS